MFSQNYLVTKNYSYSKDIYSVYNQYAKYISKLGISYDTQKWRLKHIRGFLSYLDIHKIKPNNMTAIVIYNYLKSLDNLSIRTKEHRSVCIRLFLNFLYNKKISKIRGNDVLPKIKCFKETQIPSYYTDKEINTIINSVNNKAENGKRDLAIILLFARYGLRPRDVRNMRFKNICWEENKINIIQSKTNWINVLPMDNETRYALLDYLKNERPSSDLDYIFIKNKKEIYNDHFYYNIVDKYIKLSNVNINNRRHGPYIFRHSEAYSLMKEGNGINIVANILGHTTTNSAKAYLKLNYTELKKISLEVPAWKN